MNYPHQQRSLPTIDSRRQPYNTDLRFKQNIIECFFVRFHMLLILSGVFLSGVVASKLLLYFGIKFMLLRYPLAVMFSYALFFLFVRIWLWYISEASKTGFWDAPVESVIDFADVALDIGRSGGAGRSSDLKAAAGDGLRGSIHNPYKGDSGGLGVDFDLEEGIILLIFALLLIAIFGAGAYLIYEAPAILTETAFQAVLASSLVKASKRMDRLGWMGSVLKATWVPFLLVLVMTSIFGWVASVYCPEATKLAELF